MKVLIGLSGGVDSAVAAYLMKKAGHDVVGATMSVWDKSGSFPRIQMAEGCFSPLHEKDEQAAKHICELLDIPHHTLDCSELYKRTVLENFKSEYLSGRTPNPCVWCNAKIKFKAFPEAASAAGIVFDKFVTGHYARIVFNPEKQRYQLLTGIDVKKDQSYFLYRLDQDQLSRTLFPLGEKTKSEIRQIAREIHLPVSEKKDSQDFYSGDINDILQEPPVAGYFVTTDGEIMGTHKGFWNYTVGQRKGLGISAKKPLYVIGFDKEKNNVIVGFEDQNVCHGVTALAYIGEDLSGGRKLYAKIRSSQQKTPVRVIPLGSGEIKVDFDNQQRGVACGQSVVLYDADAVVGGAVIQSVF